MAKLAGATRASGVARTPSVTAVPVAPTPEQHLAADPESSVWVSASAGTGKTRVLSNRMLRLLLHGNDPASILCLTYTKAGAAEMARRVQDDLVRFATLPDEVLALELDHLLGRPPHAEELVRARDGLLQVLDLPSGLRIMTIHSFCQSLLRRFPLEAGVSPHFELMEPRAAATLLQHARDEVLISPNAMLRKAVERLAVALGESSLGEGLAALNARRGDVTRLLARHEGDVEALVGLVFSSLGVEAGTSVNRLREGVCTDPARDEPALLAAASALGTGSDADRLRGEDIGAWLHSDHAGRLQHFSTYESVFLRADRQPKAPKNLATKAVTSKLPHAWQALEAEQGRLLAAADQEKAIGVAEKTAALLRVGAAIIQTYERRKLGEGKLDYTDLIDKSRALLQQAEAGDWVRYKLDQRIDHVLIDESQDTSPDQWAIVEALIDDFFSGDSARDKPPTLFVVGDEKQSIFGFQGADVETFQRLRQTFNERAAVAGLAFRDAPLERSFRSAPAILEVVDAVFADPAIGAGVHSGEQAMQHQAFKEEALGLVEVWPLIEPEKKDEPGLGWTLPDRAVFDEPVELRLARSIAEQIRRWLRDEAQLFNQDRPIEPKDVMILLPRRGVLQDRLVRELKRNNVPVAGADRLTLTDELAVMDLMALGDALLQPEDDLTVATMLRSPLFGLSDDDLFALAHERGERPLYRRLADLRDEKPIFAEADDRFQALLAKVDYAPPYDFFARFLCEGAPNGRQRLLRRLGPAAALPIEAFLAQAVAYERSHPPSMQGFLHWLRADSDAIKRDAQETRNEVRVLTVHGSKGLEAPIVFLADATYQKTLQKDRLLWRDDGLPLWKVSEKERDRQSGLLYEQQENRQQAEHRRLLYVAMTRAEERLIVAGCRRGGKDRSEKLGGPKNWYDMIVAGLEKMPNATSAPLTLPTGQKGECWRFGDGSADRVALGQTSLSFSPSGRSSAPIPSWLADLARGEVRVEALRPSSEAAADDPPAASPLSDEDQRRFGRGLLIHRLLQILPGIENQEAVMARYLAKPGFRLDVAAQADITAQILTILNMPAWADLFGPRSRAEVPLVGEIGGRLINGQVDRLAVLDDRVIVLDYKTNRPLPRDPDDVPLSYCRQMAIYRTLLREIYPDRQVQCALLWTEGPDLMILSDRQLNAFEPRPVVEH